MPIAAPLLAFAGTAGGAATIAGGLGLAGSLVSANAASKAQQQANSTNAQIARDTNAQNWNQYLLARGINPGNLPGVPGGAVNTVLPLGFTLNGQPAEQAIFNRIMQTGGFASPAPGVAAQSQEQLLGSEEALSAYFASDPAFAAEYTRHMAQAGGTDRRTQGQWMRDFLTGNPEQLTGFQAFFAPASATGIAAGDTTGITTAGALELPPQYQKLMEYGPQTLDQLYGGDFLARQQAAQGDINAARLAAAATVQQRIDEQRAKFGQLNTGQLSDLDRILSARTTGSQGIYDADLLQADTYANAVKQATADELQRQRAARALQGFVGSGSGDALLRARTLAGGYQAAGNARAAAGAGQARRLYDISDSDVTSRFNINSEYLKALAQLLDADAAAARAGAGVMNATDSASVLSNDISTRLANLSQPATLVGQRMQLEDANRWGDTNNLLSALNFFRQSQPSTPGYVAPQISPTISGGQILGAGLSSVGTGLSQYYQNQQLVNALKGLGRPTAPNPVGYPLGDA